MINRTLALGAYKLATYVPKLALNLLSEKVNVLFGVKQNYGDI